MTFAERQMLADAYERCSRLWLQNQDLLRRLEVLTAHVDAETERRMDLSQRVTALEASRPTLKLKDKPVNG